jgi:Fe-S-cluster containining protein
MEKVALEYRVGSELVTTEVDVPQDQIRLDQILPVLHVLDDQLSTIAIREGGHPVTCAKGCSACCKIQPVPVTPVEAYGLRLLVNTMEESRRTEVLARFEYCTSQLEAANLKDVYLEGRKASSDEEAQANAKKYLDLKLECPFLEADSCSIYEARPFSCREYFVTSPKELCVDPISLPVRRVAPIVSGAMAILGATADLTGAKGYTVPLTLAIAYSDYHTENMAGTYPGRQVFDRSILTLFASNRRM